MTAPRATRTGAVTVVGGGIVGLACAFHLRRDGWAVSIVEADEPAGGASRGNAGAFAFSDILPLASPGIMRRAPRWLFDPLGPLSIRPAYLHRLTPWLLRFWLASRPSAFARGAQVQSGLMRLAACAMDAMLEEAGLQSHVRANGNLELYDSEDDWRRSLAHWAFREAADIAFEHVRGDRLAELQPGLARRFRVGTFTPEWRTVDDPHRFALALLDHLLEAGVAIRTGRVTRVRAAEGAVALDLEGGAVLEADHVVIAAGAWSKPLAAALGDRVPLDTERGYNTTLPAGSFDLRRQLTFGGHGFVVAPTGGGVRVGGAVEFAGLRAPPNYARADAMLRRAATFLPGLRTSGGTQWMGLRPSLPDSLPVIGRSTASPRVLYAFGHGHLGLTQSAATGRLVADLMGGRATAIPMEPFRPDRFRRTPAAPAVRRAGSSKG